MWAHDKLHNLYQKACHCERSEAISKGIARPWEIAALPAVARNDSLIGAICRAPDFRVVANESPEILIFQSSEFEDSHA